MLLFTGSAAVGVKEGVGDGRNVGDAVGVGVNGEGGNGVLVGLTRNVSVCKIVAGMSTVNIRGSGWRLKYRKTKKPPRIITLAPRTVVPLVKKDLI
jgi:hypothetical protein